MSNHPEWVPPPARTEAPSDRSPRGGTEAALTPQGCRATRQSGARRQGTLAAPGAAAARRLPQHDGLSSTWAWTEAMEVPTIPNTQRTSSGTDPRRQSKRPHTERAHIPTIPTPAERARQAALHTDPHQAADGACTSSAASLPVSAASPLPGGQHAADTPPRGPAADQRPEQGVRGQTPQSPPPRKQGATTPVPVMDTGQPTNWARTPRGSPPQLQHIQTAVARRTHRDNGSTTRAAQEQTKK